MADIEEKKASVLGGTKAFAALELGLETQKQNVDAVIAAVRDCASKGIGTQTEALTIINQLEKIRGDLSGIQAKVIPVHKRCTKIAKREKCDAVIPGGYAIGGDVSTQSGGNR
jgi:hypothetical protein